MKLYVIGDSISLQYGPHLEAYLRGTMEYDRKSGEAEAMMDLDNPQGANGGDSEMVLAFMRGLARTREFTADILLVNCGLHDIKRDPQTHEPQVPLERYRENLKQIVETSRQIAGQMIWVRTTPVDQKIHNQRQTAFFRFEEDLQAYNQAADAITAAAGVPAVDLHTFTLRTGEDLFTDHVHFREEVQQKQAAFLAGWVASYTALNPAR